MSHLELFDEWDLDWVDPEALDDPLRADDAGDKEELADRESAPSS